MAGESAQRCRHGGRGMGGGEHQSVRMESRLVVQSDLEARRCALGGHSVRPRVPNDAARPERLQLRLDIAAEHLASGKQLAVRRRGLPFDPAGPGFGQPAREPVGVVGRDAYPARGNVDAVARVRTGIGQALAEPGARLHHDDARIFRAASRQMEGDRRPVKPPPAITTSGRLRAPITDAPRRAGGWSAKRGRNGTSSSIETAARTAGQTEASLAKAGGSRKRTIYHFTRRKPNSDRVSDPAGGIRCWSAKG